MSNNPGVLVLNPDAILKGEVRKCRQMHVYGYFEGTITADDLVIHEGGRCYGTARSNTADISGQIQGDVFINNLINIRSTGDVAGNVHYGQVAMQHGASLHADMRNVPPTLAGDFNVSVHRGGSVIVTTMDMTALDPDDTADHLVYHISNVHNGYLAFTSRPSSPVLGFTQAELAAGQIMFVHDGAAAMAASFDAFVADHSGATSGAAKTVSVSVIG